MKRILLLLLATININQVYAQCVAPSKEQPAEAKCDGFKAKWGNVNNATYYLDVATSADFSTSSILPNYNNFNVGTNREIFLTGLAPGQKYYYRVRANGGCGAVSANSESMFFSTLSLSIPITREPSDQQCNGFKATWNAVTNPNAEGYYIDVATDVNFTPSSILSAYNNKQVGGQEVILTGLTPGTIYYYRVRATSSSCGTSESSIPKMYSTSGAASISYPSSPYCKSITDTKAVTRTGTTGGSYSASPAGLTINSSTGTITPSTSSPGNYTVTYTYNGGSCFNNASRTTSTTVIIASVPATPSAITVPTTKCANTTGNAFSITPVNGATSYTWSVTGTGWAITGGGSTNSANITIGSGQGTVSVVATNSCGASTPYSVTITPTATNTVTQASSSPSVYRNETMTAITHSTTGATGIGTATGLPAGVTASWANSTITISGAPTTAGTFNYSIPLTGGCGSVTATGTITVLSCTAPSPLAPGANYWNGYVYNYTGDTPAATTYVGTVAESPIFDRNVGEATITGNTSVRPNDFCRTAQTDKFFVTYLMKVTIAETGIYNFTVGGDDGYRLYVGDETTPVMSNWQDHDYTTTAAQKHLTAGEHLFRLEYYENLRVSRVSFSYGLTKGDGVNLPFGDRVWNVYGFTKPSLDFAAPILKASYAGYYVDANRDINSQAFWNKTTSPSNYTNWQGAPIQNDNFTVSYRRKGFECGYYQIKLVNADDDVEVYINGERKYQLSSGYGKEAEFINAGEKYLLNETTEMEVRLKENGGFANVAFNFEKVDFIYDGITTPPSGAAITIEDNITLASDLEVCSCTITAGKILTVPANRTLTVINKIDINENGKLVIADKGSLLQNEASTFTQITPGSFIYKRTSAPMKNYDYTYWSSSVVGQTAKALSPNTYRSDYYYWKNGWVFWTGLMQAGKGYIIAVPRPGTYSNNEVAFASGKTYSQPVQFIGVPNNGTITTQTPLGSKDYLVGNPYPSAIDAEQFLEDNKNSIKGSLYIWNNSDPSLTGKNLNNNDYKVYNAVGITKTQMNDTGLESSNNFEIAGGQAFFVQTMPTTTGEVIFNNGMRRKAKTGQNSKTNSDKSRIWLNLTNEQGAFKQLLVGYVPEATNEYEPLYDAETYNGNAYVNFYSLAQNKTLTIQGRLWPFSNSDVIPLGYSSTIAGNFTIAIDETDGDLTNQAVFIEDKLTGITYNLRKAGYTFATDQGTFNDRFVLKYSTTTLGNDDFEKVANGVTVSVANKNIRIEANAETMAKVWVYNMSGKVLYSKERIGQTQLQIANLKLANQVLVVKVELENGAVVTRKIVF
ncbi:T9SS sorting signal type C domain-containing protein [Flavobacterium agrisoli]|uniref:T9SS sorting signal type C domain-containing protein n=1 Tax=Flavobacterium agrisoli TaxID=2793066 RepID=A0A934PMT4_9FLAO|nr:T9SS sorting signal type C domain-containing protein [Flavobacterium agrisoli]MBK0369818.1 T9SS sorting signal type C domain-containing protein [Flavobacterium agrisoli]